MLKYLLHVGCIFACFFAFVWIFAARLHTADTEAKLISESLNVLQENGLENISVQIRQDNARLQGQVSSTTLKEKATFLINQIEGVHDVNTQDLVVESGAVLR